MIIRKLILLALVASSGISSIIHASDAPKINAEKTQTWAQWYKRNRSLVGAATGAAICGFLSATIILRHFNHEPSYAKPILIASAIGSLGGALAAKFNALGAYCGAAIFGLFPFVQKTPQDDLAYPIVTGGIGAIAGAVASHRKILPGFFIGAASLALLGQDPLLLAPGAILGAGIHEVYNSDEPENDK